MKRIRHSKFISSETYPLLGWRMGARREKGRERIRRQAEDFINEIGPSNVVSVIEHEPLFGQFSVVVWWLEEVPEGEPMVIRAAGDNPP